MPLTLAPATGTVLDRVLRDTYPVWDDGLSSRPTRATWAACGGRRGARRISSAWRCRTAHACWPAPRGTTWRPIDGRIRRVLGIGSVFTPRELRGRGAASEMIAHLVEAAEAEGYEFAALFSDIGPPSTSGSTSCRCRSNR